MDKQVFFCMCFSFFSVSNHTVLKSAKGFFQLFQGLWAILTPDKHREEIPTHHIEEMMDQNYASEYQRRVYRIYDPLLFHTDYRTHD